MKKKLKIIIITKGFEGGAGTYTIQMLRLRKYIKNSSIEALVLQEPTYRNVHSSSGKISYLHTPITPEYYGINFPTLKLLIFELIWLKKELSKADPDIVISVDTHSNFLITFLKLIFFRTIKVICTHHTCVDDNLEQRVTSTSKKLLKYILGKILYQKADAIVGVSKGVSEDVKNFFNLSKDVKTIYNGVKVRNGIRRQIPKSAILVSICRLTEQKDPLNLINAFKNVSKIYPQAKLLIIGDGPQKNILIKTIISYRLSKKILLLGWKQNPETYLKRATLFILSTRREGFPYSILEAMNLGIPIIATDAPFGPSEALDKGKYGILTSIHDEKSLFEAIVKLLGNKNKLQYYANQSQKRSTYFKEEKMLNEYASLISDLIQK